VNIQNTLRYVTIEQAIFQNLNDEFHVATAKNVEEASKLVATGFEYVCTTPENIMLFKKRK